MDYLIGAESAVWTGDAVLALDQERTKTPISTMYGFENQYTGHSFAALVIQGENESQKRNLQFFLNTYSDGTYQGLYWTNNWDDQGNSRAQDYGFGNTSKTERGNMTSSSINRRVSGIGYINGRRLSSSVQIKARRLPKQTTAQLRAIVEQKYSDNGNLDHIFLCSTSTIQGGKEIFTFRDNVILTEAQMQQVFDAGYKTKSHYTPVANFTAQVELDLVSGAYKIVSSTLQNPTILRLPSSTDLAAVRNCQP